MSNFLDALPLPDELKASLLNTLSAGNSEVFMQNWVGGSSYAYEDLPDLNDTSPTRKQGVILHSDAGNIPANPDTTGEYDFSDVWLRGNPSRLNVNLSGSNSFIENPYRVSECTFGPVQSASHGLIHFDGIANALFESVTLNPAASSQVQDCVRVLDDVILTLKGACSIGGGGATKSSFYIDTGVTLTLVVEDDTTLAADCFRGPGDLNLIVRAGSAPGNTTQAAHPNLSGTLSLTDETASLSEPTAQWVQDFTTSDYYSAAAGNMRGNASGFTVVALVRPNTEPTAVGAFLANFRNFAGDGGWMLGYDTSRFVIGVTQDSDGAMVYNGTDTGGTSFIQLGADMYHRVYHLALVYDGTDAECYVNGRLHATITPTSGYRLSNASYTPYIGRNDNAANANELTDMGLLGFGYVESVYTSADLITHWGDCLEANEFVDGPTSFTNWYSLQGEASAPATLVDQGASLDFTMTGTVTLGSKKIRW